MKKLPILTQATSMLVCGEDLGMVPDCVPWVMDQLQILSLEIQRMPKNPKHEFGHVWEYPYRSVCTISTHDMSTLRGWWEEDYEQTCRYYNHVMGHWGRSSGFSPGMGLRGNSTPPSGMSVIAVHPVLSGLAVNRRRNPLSRCERGTYQRTCQSKTLLEISYASHFGRTDKEQEVQ